MKKAIIAALILVAQPAEAEACHRFSNWRYPYPQRCSVSYRSAVRIVAFVPNVPNVMPPSKLLDPSPEPQPTIEVIPPPIKIPEFITPPMEEWDEVQHEAAIIKMRLMQQNKWKDR